MKKHIVKFGLVVFLAWCTGCGASGNFNRLKAYMDQTKQGQIDAAVLFKYLKAVYEPLDTGIPFLISMTKSKDPTDAVAAYFALSELCAQVKMTPTPQGQEQVNRIDLKQLFQTFEKFDKTLLKGNWIEWFSNTHKGMKQTLEPSGFRLSRYTLSLTRHCACFRASRGQARADAQCPVRLKKRYCICSPIVLR